MEKQDMVRIPRQDLQRLEAWITAATRRLADTPGIETQALAEQGEGVLLDLCAAWAKDDTRVALWGGEGVRPALPTPPKANGATVKETKP
jgi:hypothetical protein